MPHMVPEYDECDWYEAEGPRGIDFVSADLVGDIDLTGLSRDPVVTSSNPPGSWVAINFPQDAFPVPNALADYVENIELWSLKRVKGVGARLTAPGYCDCTEWSVFDTMAEARKFILDTYEICPTCGSELTDAGYCNTCRIPRIH
jgi:hypothetical protein